MFDLSCIEIFVFCGVINYFEIAAFVCGLNWLKW